MAEKNAKVMVSLDAIENIETKVNEVMNAAGVSEKDRNADCTPAAGVKRGDILEISGIRKVRQNATDGFLPCTFTTTSGQQIGCKHFSKVEDMPAEAPGIGRTVTDAAKFAVFAMENHLKFEVTSIREVGEGKYTDDNGKEQTYTKRDISLAIAN